MPSIDNFGERSKQLLQSKLRILYFLYKKGKFVNNKSEIGRVLKYEDDSNVNSYVNELISENYRISIMGLVVVGFWIRRL